MRPRAPAALCGAPMAACAMLMCAAAQAHGIAGDRFFPATLATDDPAVADELSAPTVGVFRNGEDPAAEEVDISGEWSKRLTRRLGVSFAGTWTSLRTPGVGRVDGFQNLETTLKYQLLISARHEAIVSIGVSGEWGGSGDAAVGAEKIGTVTPTIYFGKGAGDLPDSVGWARPLALTGVLGYAIPTRGHELAADPSCAACAPTPEAVTRSLTYGVTLQYSLRYLTSHVKDLGLPPLVSQLTPLVEFAASTPVAHANGSGTTGTVNPGVIWSGRRMQLGLEAQVPLNRASGGNVGILFQVHWFLDDLFPRSIGRPIW